MESKISVHKTYIFGLENTTKKLLSSHKNNFCDVIFELSLCTLGGFLIFYVLYRIVLWLHSKYCADLNNTIYNKDNCPICLNEFAAPIRVNCGHAFCLECLLGYIQINPYNNNCPLCRNFIEQFECLNKYTFEDKERTHVAQLEEALRTHIPEHGNAMCMFFKEEHAIIFITIMYLLMMCGIYSYVHW